MKDQTVIVTGGSSGIGRATCLLFADKGANVVVSDVNDEGGKETTKMIEEKGGKAIYVHCDVADKVQVEQLFQATVEEFDNLHAVVNNAGIAGTLEFFHKYPDEVYDKIIAVNQTGVYYCMKAALSRFVDRKQGGKIVNVSSVAGIGGAPRMSAYAASKHAVIGLTKAAVHEYGKYNIRVNAVCPTVIETPMASDLDSADPQVVQMMKFGIPMKRFGQPEEVAQTIVWLCSDDSSFINGMEVRVDGGMRS